MKLKIQSCIMKRKIVSTALVGLEPWISGKLAEEGVCEIRHEGILFKTSHARLILNRNCTYLYNYFVYVSASVRNSQGISSRYTFKTGTIVLIKSFTLWRCS